MGIFHVNSVGWKGDSLVDKKFHDSFLADVRQAVDIWKIMGNEAATVTTGVAVDYLSREAQTRNCVEGLKRAAEIVEGGRYGAGTRANQHPTNRGRLLRGLFRSCP